MYRIGFELNSEQTAHVSVYRRNHTIYMNAGRFNGEMFVEKTSMNEIHDTCNDDKWIDDRVLVTSIISHRRDVVRIIYN